MAKVAIIEAKPSRNDYISAFGHAFKFDRYSLTSNASLPKVLKKDVDIEIDIDSYDWVILVGSEPLKFYTKLNSVTTYTGQLVDEKFIPIINPAMIRFKPEAKKPWEESVAKIIKYVSGEITDASIDDSVHRGIQDPKEALEYVRAAIEYDCEYVALDSETTSFYPRNGYMLGFSLSYQPDVGAYVSTEAIDEHVEEALQELFNKKIVIFHNAKFDIAFFTYHFGFYFPRFEDTMLVHYMLDETPGTHGLKDLAMKYTKYGDYERAMYDWIADYCKRHSIKKEDFTFDLIPFDVMEFYASLDSVVTFLLYEKFMPYLKKNNKLMWVYRNILLPGCMLLVNAQDNGVPFDIDRLKFVQKYMEKEIADAVAGLSNFPEIAQFEEYEKKQFNPNSTVQLRKLLFDYIGLKPTGKKTGKGADSTDAEVLEILAKQHPVPEYILKIRKSSKIKNTYIDKIIPQLDSDSRLRTNFNQHVTTSGRLSSSGKLNMQQLPRDNPAVKGCIKARPGYKIVSMDLTTAEMYVAAILSDDLELQDVFRTGGDFHSAIAKKVFKLDCPVEDVAELHKSERQAAKAISFGILYGAGPDKVAATAGISVREAKGVINEYFETFWKLAEWIEKVKTDIRKQAYIYSPFGRKRRLPNVKSENSGIQGHEIRSGLNFVVQSTASDVNLLGAIDMASWLHFNSHPIGKETRIFALVHDSILAEVREEHVDMYCEKLKEIIQKDRGVSIPGCPIGCDFEVGDDYSFSKFEDTYGELYEEWKSQPEKSLPF
jgi:DNA polymerase I-like protein with 3'-5' exonuclease and polymerase domains